MKRFKRSQIENFILSARKIDWSKASQECWEETFRRIQAMKKSLDAEKAEVKSKLKVVNGSVRD